MASVVSGLIVKRPKDTTGLVTEQKVPFLPKSLASLIYTSTGATVESEITRLDNRLNNMSVYTKVYENMDAYNAAIADGTAQPDGLYIVNI